MAPNYHNSNWVQNYFFVDMPSTDASYVSRANRRDKTHNLSGMLKVRLVTADPLFIGSGFKELEDGQFVKQMLAENGKPIIPGSGLKGAVRQICRAVSHSCVPMEATRINLPSGTKLQCKPEKKAEFDKSCIVCDMFGKMGWSSKVFFSDLTAESAETKRFNAAQQFLPHPDAEKYMDEKDYHAFKFYKTKISAVTKPQTDLLRAVPPKTVFTGEITYQHLDETELGLLLFGLGQSRTISLKLGGYRNEGFGTVNLTLTFDEIADPLALAKGYIASLDEWLKYSIKQLESDMPYKA